MPSAAVRDAVATISHEARHELKDHESTLTKMHERLVALDGELALCARSESATLLRRRRETLDTVSWLEARTPQVRARAEAERQLEAKAASNAQWSPLSKTRLALIERIEATAAALLEQLDELDDNADKLSAVVDPLRDIDGFDHAHQQQEIRRAGAAMRGYLVARLQLLRDFPEARSRLPQIPDRHFGEGHVVLGKLFGGRGL